MEDASAASASSPLDLNSNQRAPVGGYFDACGFTAPSSAVKMVIGTLYCSEKAYAYGLKTAAEALQPFHNALDETTW